ncbi:NAD-dependent epimerase/dehydratase family protein [Anaeromyxobacter paludicola]|uniref:NAD-dependent dehydratase n=1 Tax=Anaeromyxobacter paludicola TaxID=2918171 RepID=A0ABN6N654_9BACT|nr:NAD-dependent epimerase/dehydratase family protein [Anaeromyxobacter paludicola]BDG07303.1 NAD-dependent dehydratase [Anaeromyxobacter paludicola]
MRVGVTGANGFIGNHLVRFLLARGEAPVAFVQRGSDPRPLADLRGAIPQLEGDLLDPASLDRLAGACDVLVHLAAVNRYWAEDPAVFARVNVAGARNVAEACRRAGTRKLVHASSCITLGASDAPVPRGEDAPFNLGALSFAYAETKRAGEAEMERQAREHGLPVVIVHPTSAVGELDWGPTPIGKPVADIARGLWPVYVAGGACFIDVQDAVRGLWLALERGAPGRRYLLAGENLTNRAFMSLVAEVAGAARPRVKVPRACLAALAAGMEWAADHVTHRHPAVTRSMAALVGRYLWFDGRRAREELGFEPGPLRPAVERAVRWFRSRA